MLAKVKTKNFYFCLFWVLHARLKYDMFRVIEKNYYDYGL